jgi:hypothetical protein
VDLATAITLTGQTVIHNNEKVVNNYGERIGTVDNPAIKVIAGDTDSNYIDFSTLMKQFGDVPKEKQVDVLDKFCEEKVAKVIAGGMADISLATNAYIKRLYMKREAIASGIFVQPKKYLFEVYDMEGVRYATPKQKVTGLESQRSSTPAWCRERLKQAYKLFFYGSEAELQKFVKKTRSDYFDVELKYIAAASSANGLSKYIVDGKPIKGTPAHIKGVAAYNRIIEQRGLSGKHNFIQGGDKIKVVELIEPNPAKSETLAFADKIPPEFGIEQFVDRAAMYEKFFLTPLQRVADIVGWSCERRFVL